MDTSFWTQCNLNISRDYTTKKYFGKYLYRAVVFCPAGRLIDSKDKISDALERRKSLMRNVNYGGWWGSQRGNRELDKANVEFLCLLQDIKHEKNPDIKLRIEEPLIQIYGSTEQSLKDLIINRFGSNFKQAVQSISGPENQEAEKILNNNGIIRKIDNGYNYKVIIRDGRYQPSIKQNVLNYLNSLDDEIGLPQSCSDVLARGTPFVWNCYFYAKDLSVITFLNLIHPGLVLNYHELHVQANK